MSQNYLASRSSNLSSFNAIAMNYSTLTVSTLSGVSTLNVSRVITTSTIQVNSSMISLGASTNQVYVSSLSYGNFSTSTKWNTSMIDLLSTATIAMSANAQYQMTVSPSTTVSSIMYTSTLGQSWTTISAATGLPSATATSYTAGAVSGDGRYGALGAYGGYLYTTANSGATWTNTNPNTPAIYLPLNGSVTDIIGTSNPSVQGANAGSISYVPGIVGTRAINFANATPGGTPTQYIRGTWSGSTNATISLWFNIQSTAGFQSIFSAYQSNLYIGVSSSNMVYIDVPSGSSYQAINGPIVANNTWYNIVLIFQTNGLCSFYLNNQLIGTYTNTGIGSQATTLFSLGAYDNTITNAFNGYIDDFKIYNSAISTPPSPMVPQNWSSTALSNTGQYMIATATGAGLYMSSNFGSTWSQVTGVMLSAIWSNAQVSATGQYMLAYSTPVMVSPQLTGLTGNITTTSPVYTSWQTNGITWTSFCSSIVDNDARFQAWCAFNNLGNSSSAPYSWASARNYNTTTGAYTGSLSTTIQSVASQTGEWIQLQSSVPVVLYSYNFACGTFAAIPKTYFIIGSNDGSTWYPIQSVSIGTNPFTVDFTVATSAPIIVNQSGSQTMTAGTSGTLTCTTYTTNTTAAYTYFRLIGTSTFGSTAVRCCEITELYLNFQAGGQTYSTNYGATWNNGYALQTPTALSLSESGQYAIGANAPQILAELNFENSYIDSIGGLATGVLSGTTANVTFTSTSKVGSTSLAVTNTAGAQSGLGYVNYTIPAGHPLRSPTLLTIAFWMYPTSTSVWPTQSSPLGFNNGTNGAGPYFYLASVMSFAYYTSTGTFNAITGTTTIAQSTWVHVAITFSNGNLILYVNGVAEASAVITGSLSLGGSSSWGPITNMFIGCEHTGYGGYNGYIDNVRIYNTALSQSQINTLYTTPATAALTIPPVYITSNFLQGFSTGTSTTPTFQTPLNAATNNPVASAVSNTGQYMVIITNNVSGNNVYYSTNFGAYFAGLQLGTTLLTSCAISYDGSYITVSNATTTWTLNNNSNGFSLALGNQAGYQNQGQNAIAIGNGAGSINQTANSIILNASGSAVNSFAPGFYVAPIASYVASSSGSYNLLGYGTDNQVVQIANIIMSTAGNIGFTGSMPRIQLIDTTSNRQPSIEFIRGQTFFDNGLSYSNWRIVASGGQSDGAMPAIPAGSLGFYHNGGMLTGHTMVLSDSGNVGIGTTNPTTIFQVWSGTSNPLSVTAKEVFITGSDVVGGVLGMYITSNNSGTSTYGSTTYGRFGRLSVNYSASIGGTGNAGYWRDWGIDNGGNLFWTQNASISTAMSISSGGNLYVSSNVGIGTVFPQAILHVHESPIVGDVSRKEAIRGTRNGTGGVQNNVSMALSYGPNTIAVNPYGVIDFKVNGLPDANNGYGYIPNVTVMSVVGNGRVGIGTTTPAYPLTVYGGTGLVYNAGGNNPYLGTPTIGVQNTSSYGAVCAWFQIDVIAGGALGTFSDIRIKNKIEHITNALEKINNIPVVQHDYVDKVKYPRACSVGVIAQDIVSIIPDAVSYEKEFIPNIMQIPSQCIRIDDYIKITCDVPMDITISDTLKLVLLSEEKQVSLLYLSPDKRTIHVPAWNDNHLDQLFVYGKQIDDFHIIDKAKLGILALGGVKELYQLLMKQQSQITDLIAQVKLLTDNK